MGYRRDEGEVVITGRIEHATAKAYLIDTPNTREPIWLPKSQIVAQTQVGEDEWEFTITEWIAKQNGIPT